MRRSASGAREKTRIHVLATHFARALQKSPSLSSWRAQGKPGAPAHPQPCVQKWKTRKSVTTGSPDRSGLPCAIGFNGCFGLSLVIGLSCHHCRRDCRSNRRQRDASVEASGPHDFAVRIACTRLVHATRPSHPAPNVRDDREAPLFRARDARKNASDLPDVTSDAACDTLTRRANQRRAPHNTSSASLGYFTNRKNTLRAPLGCAWMKAGKGESCVKY